MHPSPPPPPPPPPPHPPPHCLTDEKPATTKPEFTAFCSCSSPQQTGLTSAHATSRLLFLIHDFNTTKLNWHVNRAKCRYATLVELRGLRVSFLLFHCSVWFYVYSCINDIIFFFSHTLWSAYITMCCSQAQFHPRVCQRLWSVCCCPLVASHFTLQLYLLNPLLSLCVSNISEYFVLRPGVENVKIITLKQQKIYHDIDQDTGHIYLSKSAYHN